MATVQTYAGLSCNSVVSSPHWVATPLQWVAVTTKAHHRRRLVPELFLMNLIFAHSVRSRNRVFQHHRPVCFLIQVLRR